MKIPTVAVVGSESLLGRDVRDALNASPVGGNVMLVGADEEEAVKITADADEAVIITPLDETHLATADAVILAGSPASSRKAWSLVERRPDVVVVDATRALEDLGSARLCAPVVREQEPGRPAVIANSAAIALATFFSSLETRHRVVRSIANIIEPASERGQAGIDELHQQTVKLFSFQGLPQEVFDTQVAFATLAAWGPESPHKLAQIELAVERHLASLMAAGRTPMPSLRLMHAPVFHGYSISVWAELEKAVDAEDLAQALGAEEPPPANTGIAGQSGIAIGDVRADRNHPRAFWFWIVADNLRLTADNAVRVVEQACAHA